MFVLSQFTVTSDIHKL